MYWHTRIFKSAQTVIRGTTTKFDIPVNVPIGSILLLLSANHVDDTSYQFHKWRLIDQLDDIALIGDGKTVIKSLPGQVYQAMHFYDQGAPPPNRIREYSTDSERQMVLMNLGRRYHDPEMYLPAGKFDSLELQVNFADPNTCFGNATMTIILEQPAGLGVPTSKGYLRSEVWREFTTVRDEWNYLTLPTGHIFRRIFFQAIPDVSTTYEVEKTNMWNLINELKLSFKNGDMVIFDADLETLAKIDVLKLGHLPFALGNNRHTAMYGWNCGLGYVTTALASTSHRDSGAPSTIAYLLGDVNSFTQKWAQMAESSQSGFLVFGMAPESCVPFRFDEIDDPATWFDAKAEGDVLLDFHTRDISDCDDGTIRIIFDRLVV